MGALMSWGMRVENGDTDHADNNDKVGNGDNDDHFCFPDKNI